MFCKNCGAQNEDGTKFCSKCGSPLEAQQPNVQPQTVIIQQTVTQTAPVASPAEKEAFTSTTRGIWMLIAAIVLTINLFTGLISNVLSLNIFGILSLVLDILIVVGFWVLFANGRKNKTSSTGINLIRVPYIILFVFEVISFVLHLVIWGMTLNIIGLVFGILSFVFTCICFASVKKTLDMGLLISRNHSVAGRKAGIFAAVVMIISASISLIQSIVSYAVVAVVSKELTGPLATLGNLINGGGIMSLVAAVFSFIASISVAIVLLMFAKKIKKAING